MLKTMHRVWPRAIRGAAAVGTAVWLALAGVAATVVVDTPVAAAATQYCWARLTPRDLGGGTWTNRNYVVEAPAGLRPRDPQIHYRLIGGGTLVMNGTGIVDVGRPHGIFDNRVRWGVSTWWVYLNPEWRFGDRWWLRYAC